MKLIRTILASYTLLFLAALFFLTKDQSGDFLFLLQIVTFPFSLVDFFTGGDGFVIFYALPAYVVDMIFLYWLAKKVVSFTPTPHENRTAALYITAGYLVWTAYLVYYFFTCTEKLCGLLVFISFSGLLFLFELLPNMFDSSADWSILLLIPIGTLVVYGFSRGLLRIINPPLRSVSRPHENA